MNEIRKQKEQVINEIKEKIEKCASFVVIDYKGLTVDADTALRKEFSESEVPGKRIDFICQETNREINTIGSKNQFTEVGEMVINAKDALENIREQSKNVE